MNQLVLTESSEQTDGRAVGETGLLYTVASKHLVGVCCVSRLHFSHSRGGKKANIGANEMSLCLGLSGVCSWIKGVFTRSGLQLDFKEEANCNSQRSLCGGEGMILICLRERE